MFQQNNSTENSNLA